MLARFAHVMMPVPLLQDAFARHCNAEGSTPYHGPVIYVSAMKAYPPFVHVKATAANLPPIQHSTLLKVLLGKIKMEVRTFEYRSLLEFNLVYVGIPRKKAFTKNSKA